MGGPAVNILTHTHLGNPEVNFFFTCTIIRDNAGDYNLPSPSFLKAGEYHSGFLSTFMSMLVMPPGPNGREASSRKGPKMLCRFGVSSKGRPGRTQHKDYLVLRQVVGSKTRHGKQDFWLHVWEFPSISSLMRLKVVPPHA